MKIKEFMNKSFPGSIASQIVEKQKHPVVTFVTWVVCLVIIVSGIGVLNGSGKYGHPFHKHHILRASHYNAPQKTQQVLRAYTGQQNAVLSKNYYKLDYSKKTNTVTMKLGKSAMAVMNKADGGDQEAQEQLTNVLFGQIEQSKQISQSANDKKLGYMVMTPNNTLLSYVQNGKVEYSVMPVLSTVK